MKTKQRQKLRKQQGRYLREKGRLEIEKYDRVLVETAPSCNDCVATMVAGPFTLTVRGGNQPSGEEIRVLFSRIQESGGVMRLKLKLFQTNF